MRFLHGRDALARTAVRALLHRAGKPARASGRLHRKPEWNLDSSAGPEGFQNLGFAFMLRLGSTRG
jgi:hypothetical protein